MLRDNLGRFKSRHTTSAEQIRAWQREYKAGKMTQARMHTVEKILTAERKLANNRIKQLARKGVTSRAGERAYGKILQQYGKGRTSWGKAHSFEEALNDAGTIGAFLRDETSTVTGAQNYNAHKRAEWRNGKWADVVADMNDEQLDTFLSWMHDEGLSDLMDTFADYSELLEQVAMLMSSEQTRDYMRGIMEEFKEYQLGSSTQGYSYSGGMTAWEVRADIKQVTEWMKSGDLTDERMKAKMRGLLKEKYNAPARRRRKK